MIRIVLLLALIPTVASAGEPFLRLGSGYESTAGTTVRDRDCSSTTPPALFGCVAGPDGRQLGARGDFGRSASFELGIGSTLGRRSRLELQLTSLPHLGLDAQANFLAAGDSQPVRGRIRSTSALAVLSVDIGPAGRAIRPFVFGGVGASRNHAGAMRYEFPTIDPDAVTILRGGSATSFAWTAGAGATLRLTPSVDLDLAFRQSDLGAVTTEDGIATIVRPSRRLTIAIAGTRARLVTRGATLSIRIHR